MTSIKTIKPVQLCWTCLTSNANWSKRRKIANFASIISFAQNLETHKRCRLYSLGFYLCEDSSIFPFAFLRIYVVFPLFKGAIQSPDHKIFIKCFLIAHIIIFKESVISFRTHSTLGRNWWRQKLCAMYTRLKTFNFDAFYLESLRFSKVTCLKNCLHSIVCFFPNDHCTCLSHRPAMSNPRSAGRMRPSWGLCAAQFRFTL